MKTIIIGFSTHVSSVFSWLIRKVTASTVSHVYSRHAATDPSQVLVFQASGLSVNYCNLDTFKVKSRIIEEYEVEIADLQATQNQKFRDTEVGKPYSMKQLYGFLWVLGFRKLGRKMRNPFANGASAYVCVEVAACQTGRIQDEDAEGMTPEDFRRWCQKNATRL